MKLGLLTDIHEHVEHLRKALDHFEREDVDQVVVIGDVFELGKRIEETCHYLTEAKAVGVWGNHDYGLCFEPSENVRQKYSNVVLDFMMSLQPDYEIDDCLFMHIEPWLDPENIEDLWYFDGPPETDARLPRIFTASQRRLIFVGHYHRWLWATEARIMEWDGECPIRLRPNRHFVVVGALCQGRYAIFETEQSELVPFNLGSSSRP